MTTSTVTAANSTTRRPAWYEHHDELLAFARHMVEADDWDAQALLAYLEKPWKWTPERNVWVAQTGGADK